MREKKKSDRFLYLAASAKCSRRTFYTAEQVLELLEDDENGNEGISSDKKSVLDHLLLDSEEDSSCRRPPDCVIIDHHRNHRHPSVMFKSSGVAIATVHSLLVVVDIVGNCLVCAIIKKHRDMRNPFNYLLVNLALADMLYATFITVSTFLRLMPNHPYGMGGTILCKLLTDGFLAFIAGMASVVTLLAIAAERYYAVIYPLGNVGRLTKCKLKVIIAGSWIFSLIVVTPSTLSVNVKDNACVSMVEEWMSKAYFLLWSAVVAVAIAIMAGMYSRVVYTLWFKRNPDNQLTFQQRGVLKVRKRVTLMGVTVTAIFGICWTPDIIAHLIDNFTSVSIGELAYPVLHTLMLFSSAVNPFMYALVNKTFREKLKGMICCSCICFTGITRNRDYQLNVTSTIGTSSLE